MAVASPAALGEGGEKEWHGEVHDAVESGTNDAGEALGSGEGPVTGEVFLDHAITHCEAYSCGQYLIDASERGRVVLPHMGNCRMQLPTRTHDFLTLEAFGLSSVSSRLDGEPCSLDIKWRLYVSSPRVDVLWIDSDMARRLLSDSRYPVKAFENLPS